jgi:hypothetical protein
VNRWPFSDRNRGTSCFGSGPRPRSGLDRHTPLAPEKGDAHDRAGTMPIHPPSVHEKHLQGTFALVRGTRGRMVRSRRVEVGGLFSALTIRVT